MIPTKMGVNLIIEEACRQAHRPRLALLLADIKWQQKYVRGWVLIDKIYMLLSQNIKYGAIIN